jgi:predicted transposase YdaD
MKAEKTEMVAIEFTKAELLELIDNAIKAKYPELLDEKVWQWDDFHIEKEIHHITFPDDKMAVYSMFSRSGVMAEKPLDSTPKVVYVAVQDVCR